MDITGITTEGETAACGRVRRFFLYYSSDGLRFEQYIDPFLQLGDVSVEFSFIVDFVRLIYSANDQPSYIVTCTAVLQYTRREAKRSRLNKALALVSLQVYYAFICLKLFGETSHISL